MDLFRLIGVVAIIATVFHLWDVISLGRYTIKSAVVFGCLISIAISSFLFG